LYFVGGLSELETARHIGTSQQNVSKALHEFLKRDFRAVLPPDESQILDRILGQGRFLARGRRARRGQ